MIKKILAVGVLIGILLFVITSCKPLSNMGADGYAFGTPQYEKQSVTVRVVTYDSTASLRVAAKSRYNVDNPDIAAFSVIEAPAFDVCTIHMVDPTKKYQPEFIGHEFTHCIYGQWHTDNESFK